MLNVILFIEATWKIRGCLSSALGRLYVCMASKLSCMVFAALREAVSEDSFSSLLSSEAYRLNTYDDLKKANGHLQHNHYLCRNGRNSFKLPIQ